MSDHYKKVIKQTIKDSMEFIADKLEEEIISNLIPVLEEEKYEISFSTLAYLLVEINLQNELPKDKFLEKLGELYHHYESLKKKERQ